MKIHLLFISCLCLLSKVYMQYCQTPCYCPWLPPRCPPGSPLVLDGCGCCNICARRLGEPCNHLHVCDKSQGLVCDYSAAPMGRGGVCNYEEGDDDSCEVNGKIYQDGEVFQPTCKLQCHCSGGGFTCVPLCSEDVRLPTPDCPYPRRVEIPGKCCQEWICERQDRQNFQDTMAAQRLPGTGSVALRRLCEEWSTEWSACSTSCGIGISTRVSNTNPYCRLEMQRRLCSVRPCQGFMGVSSMRQVEVNDSLCLCLYREEEEAAYKLVHIIQKLTYPSSWTTPGPRWWCFCDSEITIPEWREKMTILK